jgi:hypothetical protein
MNIASLPPRSVESPPRAAKARPRERLAQPAPKPAASVAAESRRSEQLEIKPAPRRRTLDNPGQGDLLLYLLLTVLVISAWVITQMKLFRVNDDINYWIGVIGGSMMLTLFLYPLRKYLRFAQGWGKVKWWFWFHLFLGIAGPWLILVHSTFRIGSLNAGIALYCMIIVVLSGVVGRFIYTRVHRGLAGERMSLTELRERAGMVESAARSRLHFSPAVEARLAAFEQHELRAEPGWATYIRQVSLLPIQQYVTYRRCASIVRRRMRALAAERHWSAIDLRRRERRAIRLVEKYLDAVVRVAQYTAYERVFALWHLAHLPFVYLLVICAFVHVFAVHAY